jgi:hypothetical protein
MAEFSSNMEMQKVTSLSDELFHKVLYDEEPLFISDEATLWGVSMSDPEEVLKRIQKYYGIPVTLQDTKQPLWKLLLQINERRKAPNLPAKGFSK